jgi:hypothetical protein
MRTFVGVLALFGVVLCLLVGGGYLYLSGHIPEVSIHGSYDFLIRADSQADAESVLPELETAASRFAKLYVDSPEFEIALLDGPKQLNAASILLAVRREMGAPLAKLALPFPTPRFSSMIAAQDTAARVNYRQALARRQPEWMSSQLDSAVNERFGNIETASTTQRSIGHEAAHWMLAIYIENRSHSKQPAALPPWLVEGIAGYCEPPERRLTALATLRSAMRDNAMPGIDSLTRIANADNIEAIDTRSHELGNMGGAAQDQSRLFYAECAALIAFLEQQEPGIVKRMTDAAIDSGTSPKLSTARAISFFEWIATIDSF